MVNQCWVLFDREADNVVIGIFPTYDAALDHKHSIAHKWVERVVDTLDPWDVIGHAEFTEEDMEYLYEDFMKTVEIERAPFYDAVSLLGEEE